MQRKYHLTCPECGKGNKEQEETCDNCYTPLIIHTGWMRVKYKISRHVRRFISFAGRDLLKIALVAALLRFIYRGIL